MNSAKTDGGYCPKCGGDDYEIADYEWDFDCMMLKCCYNKCEHQWREWYKLTYDGFTDESGEYDAEGKIVD